MRLLIPAALILALASCVGVRTRDTALLPAARSAWEGVHSDYQRGVEDGLADSDLSAGEAERLTGLGEEMDRALEAGAPALLATIPWEAEMAPWAVRGVVARMEAGEVGTYGAQLLLERITNFSAAVLVMQGRVSRAPARSDCNPYIRTPAERRILAALEH